MHVCVRVCVRACVYECVCVCVHACMADERINVCMCACMRVCVYVCVYNEFTCLSVSLVDHCTVVNEPTEQSPEPSPENHKEPSTPPLRVLVVLDGPGDGS